MGLDILKDGKLKKLLKKHSGRDQSAEEARERIDELVVEFLVKIAKAAGKSAESQDLTRIMPENVDEAFGEVLGESNVAPDPSKFLGALHKMEIKKLGDILRHITDWNHEDEEKR